MRVTDPKIQAALEEQFGLSALYPRQAEAIQGVLDGRDILLTMPTGAGKSLVYQLPAVVLPGLTLVVSPLIALMKDQVDALTARSVRATFVNSSLSSKERAQRLVDATRGRFDLLFVTPERFRSPRFCDVLPELDVRRLAVDEAHCVSQWGHDFRPDYSRLREYRARLGNPPTLAVTATATPRVAADIIEHLALTDPLILRSGIERPNLFLAATPVADQEEKEEILSRRLEELSGPGIVYMALIRDLEALHAKLRRQGMSTLVYHGDLSAEERRSMQDKFMGSDRHVILATNAFGMGVDKADIRFVLHAQVPRTLEAWTQEVGRAGRDGRPSYCELFYLQADVAVQQNFVGWANPTREFFMLVHETLHRWGERLQAKDQDDLRDELLLKNRQDQRVAICMKWLEVLGVTEGSFETHDLRVIRELDEASVPLFLGSEEKRRSDLEGLLTMVRFATDEASCRRAMMASHFELAAPPLPCGACDHCAERSVWVSEKLAPPTMARQPVPAPVPDSDSTKFKRGDWVRVDHRHMGQVLRVDGRGSRVRLLVESATDLRRRVVDPRKSHVERLEPGSGA